MRKRVTRANANTSKSMTIATSYSTGTLVLVVAISLAAIYHCVSPGDMPADQFAGQESESKGSDNSVGGVDPDTWMMDENTAWTDACVDACVKGADQADADYLAKIADGLDTRQDTGPIDICIVRCRYQDKGPAELGYVAEPNNFHKPSALFRQYLHCAIQCTRSKQALVLSQGHKRALAALQMCGVVHLRHVFSTKLLQRLAKAVEQLRAGKFGGIPLEELNDIGALRAGREQIWLPSVPPFTDPGLLRAEPLLQLIDAYFAVLSDDPTSQQTTLDHATIIVATAGTTGAQELHTDVKYAGRSLELHIPLQAVTKDMGPTRVCPCTHGGFGDGGAEMQNHKHLLTQKLHNRITPDDEDTCERFPNTHYDATSTFGEVTLYDSAMFHRGLANTGEMDRPILVLAFATSPQEALQRNYTGHHTVELSTAGLEAKKLRETFEGLRG